jgi:hypothetical protein
MEWIVFQPRERDAGKSLKCRAILRHSFDIVASIVSSASFSLTTTAQQHGDDTLFLQLFSLTDLTLHVSKRWQKNVGFV